ncbi:MAG: flavodoxin domain-containing protein [Paraglaciecola sp.]|nr:flavodoxin domain-containing protein [Paraglaciecola sp.]
MSPTERITLVVMILLSYSFICGYFAWQYRIRQRQSSLSNPRNSVNVLGDKFFLVAYASQSGTAEAIARRSVRFLDKKFQYKLLPLNQVNQEILANSHSALFVVSTYGEGEPPDNATAFNRQYLSNAATIDLSHLTFSVLALGDRMYEKFCAFGHQLHQGLCQLGATPLLQPMEACATDQAGEEVPYGPIFKQWLSCLGLEQENNTSLEDYSRSLLTPLSTNLLTPWKIVERVQLNPNSKGAPLYKVCLESQYFKLNLASWRLSRHSFQNAGRFGAKQRAGHT